VALNVAAQFAAVERIDITDHGNRCAGRTRLANSESRPATVLQFVHGPRVRAIRPHGADGSHRKSPKSRCRGSGLMRPDGLCQRAPQWRRRWARPPAGSSTTLEGSTDRVVGCGLQRIHNNERLAGRLATSDHEQHRVPRHEAPSYDGFSCDVSAVAERSPACSPFQAQRILCRLLAGDVLRLPMVKG
jgi:hypothetical protein